MTQLQARKTMVLLLAVVGLCGTAWADDPWADQVVAYAHGSSALYTDPSLVLGPPSGGGPSTPDNTSIVSLGGPGGSITVKFNTPCVHDDRNPFGVDFIVYSNKFWVGGNPQVRWEEPAIVEIANDAGGPWYLIPGSRNFPPTPFPSVTEPAGQSNSGDAYLLAGAVVNPNYTDADPSNDLQQYNWGYASMSPAMSPYLDNYVRPTDPLSVAHTPRSGGGDAFAISWAVDSAGNPANLTQCQYVRISSFINRNFGAVGICSPDIDAVVKVAPAVDTDGDGILDVYEIEVSHTDPLRPESTILPLEIPSIEGGSSPGTLLGTAADLRGTKLRLFADQQRTADGRALSTTVDILVPAEPGGQLPSPSLLKSGTVRQIVSSQPDFVAAGIQTAEVTIQYKSSEITGLDEAQLQPYRLNGTAYTQTGISNVQVNAVANLVTFRTQYPGLFLLASVPGSGDVATQGPQGVIALAATPADETVADPANLVSVISGPIKDNNGAVVADGTLITVATTSGDIATADADSVTPGVQVATFNGDVSFQLRAPTRAGSALITATSVQGSAYGELTYEFTSGPAIGPIGWTIGKPEGTGPVSVVMLSGVIHDQFGNRVEDQTMLTITVSGGTITSGDADLGLPGYQALVINGRLAMTVEVPNITSSFVISVYRDSAQTDQLAQDTYSPANYVPMPLTMTWLLVLAVALARVARSGATGENRVQGRG